MTKSPAKTCTNRALIARVAAHASWAMTPDRAARTAPAREAMKRKFEDQVDPDRILSESERAKRVENARQAHYLSLALKSAKARQEKRKASTKASTKAKADTAVDGL